MEGCFYCAKDQRLVDLMEEIATLEYTSVYLFRDQKHMGRCVVALRGHKTELFELSAPEREGFFREASLVAKAIGRCVMPDKINYAVYGDLVSHFHMHIVPKRKDGLQWGGPFSDTGEKLYLSDKERLALTERLKQTITEEVKEDDRQRRQ